MPVWEKKNGVFFYLNMEYVLTCCGFFMIVVLKGVTSYEACRKIKDVTVTFCEDGFYCCKDNTQCCNKGWNPVAIAALVIGGIIFIAFIIALIVLCIKRNNNNKFGNHRRGMDIDYTFNLPVGHMTEYDYTLDFPPPYVSETGDTVLELPNYHEQPPPYEPAVENAQSTDNTTSDSIERIDDWNGGANTSADVVGREQDHSEVMVNEILRENRGVPVDVLNGELTLHSEDNTSFTTANVVNTELPNNNEDCSSEITEEPQDQSGLLICADVTDTKPQQDLAESASEATQNLQEQSVEYIDQEMENTEKHDGAV